MRADNRRLSWVAVVVAVLVAVAAWKWAADRESTSGRGGRTVSPTAAAAAERYLDALQRVDRAAVADVAPPGYEASDDVDDRIAKYGGIRPGTQISLVSDLTKDVMTLRIRAIDAGGRPLRWTENLVRRPEGWYVLLGGAPTGSRGRPSSSTASP
jgi:hypothetical protein